MKLIKFFSACAFLFLTACSSETIETYKVPKGNVMPVAAGPVRWTTPAGWKEQTPSSMRVGSFLITGKDGKQADVSIIPLQGEAGGDLANINRWRGQINLEPLTPEELQKQSTAISPRGLRMRLIDFSNEDQRLVAAIYPQRGKSWFFKMMGDDAIVAQAKPDFLSFLTTLQFDEN